VRSSRLTLNESTKGIEPEAVSFSDFDMESRLLKRPEKPAHRPDLKGEHLIMKVASSATMPEAPLSRVSMLPSVNKRYKQQALESVTACLTDIYSTKATSRAAHLRKSHTISPSKLLGSRNIVDRVQSQLGPLNALFIV
jgi:hypothetical protein